MKLYITLELDENTKVERAIRYNPSKYNLNKQIDLNEFVEDMAQTLEYSKKI